MIRNAILEFLEQESKVHSMLHELNLLGWRRRVSYSRREKSGKNMHCCYVWVKKDNWFISCGRLPVQDTKSRWSCSSPCRWHTPQQLDRSGGLARIYPFPAHDWDQLIRVTWFERRILLQKMSRRCGLQRCLKFPERTEINIVGRVDRLWNSICATGNSLLNADLSSISPIQDCVIADHWCGEFRRHLG